ncbi:hypothetical protein T4C_5386 [Trichinella pseudospiralis]|uniref:Uncharacterized protein n=1 Tax=Trichinella pseudospiralis TaxID=6337 RepID=A0A0V1KF36_TRIPS|nr:hypothetical protein T4C_5386 [Trichinella pseudospiralis]
MQPIAINKPSSKFSTTFNKNEKCNRFNDSINLQKIDQKGSFCGSKNFINWRLNEAKQQQLISIRVYW